MGGVRPEGTERTYRAEQATGRRPPRTAVQKIGDLEERWCPQGWTTDTANSHVLLTVPHVLLSDSPKDMRDRREDPPPSCGAGLIYLLFHTDPR